MFPQTSRQFFGIQIPQFSIIFFHLFFIFLLVLIHLGFHWIDFLLLQAPENFFEGTLILTSMDAYYYAKGTRDFLNLLSGDSETLEIFKAFVTLHPLALLGGILAKWTSLAFVLTWSSVILSISTGISLYLLGYQILLQIIQSLLSLLQRQNKQATESPTQTLNWTFSLPCIQFLAFLASLVAILSPSFYQRVGVGYFDTDMLLLVFPLLAFIFLLHFLNAPQLSFKFLALFGVFGYLAIAWHKGIQNLLLLGFLLFVVLEIIKFLKARTIPPKSLALISVFLIILTPSSVCLLAFILLLIGIGRFSRLWIGLLFSLGYAIAFGLFNPFLTQINAYFFGSTQDSNAYVYASVVNGILETMPISLATLIERSGGIMVFGCGLLGFLCFGIFGICLRFHLYSKCLCFSRLLESNSKTLPLVQEDSKDYGNPFKGLFEIFLFLLPFCLLGLGAIPLGARFSFFLTPIIALGLAFLGFGVLNVLKRFSIPALFVSSTAVAIFIANLQYKIPPPILTQAEIQAFRDLDSKLNLQDIVFSWWDYGYALSYFTKAQVLLNGARHSGAVNFPIAKILLSPSPTLFYHFSLKLAQAMQTLSPKQWNQIFEILSHNQDADAYLNALELESQTLELSNGAKVYWVLPLRILPLLANINAFANVDLKNGKPLEESIFVFWDSAQNAPNFQPQTILNLYDNFYTSLTDTRVNLPLTQINFGRNSLLLNSYYLKSNLIQMLLFGNYPAQISASGGIVRILQLH
ncbi:STT3 domain-containing protein [Helicobacter sp.]|uniref:STT3 domain-containing protein n=1 Tax=Helicobacter sp. TaxID=218 RepID=UPI00199EC95E|nr:STT3 domain-containing protein [Helicobacter sp.]MBD5166016.1 peptide transporter [Helicobacter sp.]